MTATRHTVLALLLTAACTSLDPATVQDPAESADGGTPPRVDAKPHVSAAIGSVRLEQDCPDPPGATAAAADESRGRESAKSLHASAIESERGAEGDRAERRCEQSTLQMSLDNTGPAAASIHVEAIRLRDVQSDSTLAAVTSRGPSAWSPDGTYVGWDEKLAASAKLQVSYRLTPPDWSAVEAKLGGATSTARDFVLEVTLQIDGKPLTVRSPAFRRPAPEKFDMVET